MPEYIHFISSHKWGSNGEARPLPLNSTDVSQISSIYNSVLTD